MKKTVTLALTLSLVLRLLSGCVNADTPADNAETSAETETTFPVSTENFSDGMDIPYAVDLSSEDGADSVDRSGDHWQTIIGYDTMGTEATNDDVFLVASPAEG